MSIEELKNKDNSFTEGEFISKVENIYSMILISIITENVKRVKHKISNEIYEKISEYIEKLKNNNKRQIYEDINIKETTIEKIEEDDNNFYIEVVLTASFFDYIINKDTLKIIEGDNKLRVVMKNYIRLKKEKNKKDTSVINKCHNCGAPVDTNRTGICDFCHEVYDSRDYDWTYVDIKRGLGKEINIFNRL